MEPSRALPGAAPERAETEGSTESVAAAADVKSQRIARKNELTTHQLRSLHITNNHTSTGAWWTHDVGHPVSSVRNLSLIMLCYQVIIR
jgi:hypothetical protein